MKSKNAKTSGVLSRRKREGRTNYIKRIALLKSGKPRLVVRKSLRGIVAQIVNFDPKGDVVVVSSHSNGLKKYGFKTIKGNLVSAYFVGLVIGKSAVKKGIKEAILDAGLNQSTKGSKIYAVVKGAVDAGLNVPVSKEVLPDQKRIEGKHIEDYAKIVKQKGAKGQFSVYEKHGISHGEISGYFNDIKKKILEVR